MSSITRRDLVAGLACAGLAASAPAEALRPSQTEASASRTTAFIDVLRVPDAVTVFCGLNHPSPLSRSGTRWSSSHLQIITAPQQASLPITLSPTPLHPTHIHLRWSSSVAPGTLVLNDAWERSYGNLHWESLVPERVLPWYFLTANRELLNGYGVRTGAAALCFWQIDPKGISLWLNVCNGGDGVHLRDRELLTATVVSRQGMQGESALDAARLFCRSLCDHPRPPVTLYGSNDWYYAYGHNTAAQIVRDAELVASLVPAHAPRPFTVVDGGWDNRKAFPDMGSLAASVRRHHVRPGIWIRPLQADADTPPSLLLPAARFKEPAGAVPAFDPTVPEALERVLGKVTQAVGWGYDLIKHDFSTYDLLGQWGFQMGAQPTLPRWSLHDRTHTNAEIIRSLYQSIRQAAGDSTVLLGCNTVGHLAAGLFDAQRTGDDVSGQFWERTRRMGVNTLAFRIPQHRSFFALDPDCVPITTKTPWSCNRQWLDLVARSGVVLFVSPQPAAMGPEQREAVRAAFELCTNGSGATASAWEDNTTPDHWQFSPAMQKDYDWYQQSGAWPFKL